MVNNKKKISSQKVGVARPPWPPPPPPPPPPSENPVYCKETGIWYLTDINGKDMFSSLYRLTNALLNDLCIQNLEL